MAWILITAHQRGTFEMREGVLDSPGAPEMDTSSSDLSDLRNNDVFWETPHVELDAVLSPGIDTPFSPTAFNNLELGEGGSSKHPSVLDEKEDKEKLPPNNSSVWESHWTSEVAQKSSFLKTD